MDAKIVSARLCNRDLTSHKFKSCGSPQYSTDGSCNHDFHWLLNSSQPLLFFQRFYPENRSLSCLKGNVLGTLCLQLRNWKHGSSQTRARFSWLKLSPFLFFYFYILNFLMRQNSEKVRYYGIWKRTVETPYSTVGNMFFSGDSIGTDQTFR